jgi:hypothetical protein
MSSIEFRLIPLTIALATLSVAAPAQPGTYQNNSSTPKIETTRPIPGVWVRSADAASVLTVSANAGGAEIRIAGGRANVQVLHPAQGVEILVDLPGGQAALVKDGLYTFNADTDTMTVVHGEADAYPGADQNAKPIKVKEDRQLTFEAGAKAALTEPDRPQLLADVLPGERPAVNGYANHGDGPYVYPAPYPYYAYGWGYPYYGYGYPVGVGLGFGFYGRGFYGGGFRGGFRR